MSLLCRICKSRLTGRLSYGFIPTFRRSITSLLWIGTLSKNLPTLVICFMTLHQAKRHRTALSMIRQVKSTDGCGSTTPISQRLCLMLQRHRIQPIKSEGSSPLSRSRLMIRAICGHREPMGTSGYVITAGRQATTHQLTGILPAGTRATQKCSPGYRVPMSQTLQASPHSWIKRLRPFPRP